MNLVRKKHCFSRDEREARDREAGRQRQGCYQEDIETEEEVGSPSWARTSDPRINSPAGVKGGLN